MQKLKKSAQSSWVVMTLTMYMLPECETANGMNLSGKMWKLPWGAKNVSPTT